MKYAGIAALLLSTAGIGEHFAFKLREKWLICRELKQLCDIVSIDISFKKNSVILLLKENRFSRLGFITADTVKKECELKTPLTSEENEELSRFLFSLGKSDAASQLKLIEGFKEYISLSEEKYYKLYQKDAKLYRTLGVFCGAALGLIVI